METPIDIEVTIVSIIEAAVASARAGVKPGGGSICSAGLLSCFELLSPQIVER